MRLLLAGACLMAAALWMTAAASPRQAKSGQATATHSSGKKTAPSLASFVDVTRASGIDFHLTCGSLEKRYIMESMCGGIAVFDYDNDGWMDILLVNGSTLEDLRTGKCHTSKLYHNNHDGTFTDVTTKAGLTHCGWGFGVAVGDYDNDGWEDLYITYLDGAVLYHNNRDGTFTDVTSKAGVGNAGRWGTSAAFGDYDNDGYLDLYVANYVDLDIDHLPEFGVGPFCQYRGIPVSCGPRGLKGGRDRLYHNNGNGTFTDVSEKLNIDPAGYYGLGVLWLDYDLDGCLDLYVANDSSPSLLYHNDCKGGFTEVGVEAGVAYSADGREQAGMGIDSADYDNDGWPDIAKANFSDDSNNLYHNDHNGEFTDMAGPAGFGAISIPFLGFGMKFLDFDNDGWKDIFVANGHVNPQVDQCTLVGHAEPTTHGSLTVAENIVGEADTRTEIVVITLSKRVCFGKTARSTDTGHAGRSIHKISGFEKTGCAGIKNLPGTGLQVINVGLAWTEEKVRDQPILLHMPGIEVITQPQVKSQPPRGLPIVLEVPTKFQVAPMEFSTSLSLGLCWNLITWVRRGISCFVPKTSTAFPVACCR